MNISRYEEARKEALRALHRAIIENRYNCHDEYIIAIENVTDGYNVDFTYTDSGKWADEVFEQSRDTAIECALSHKGTRYIVIFAKCHQDCTIDYINEYHIIK